MKNRSGDSHGFKSHPWQISYLSSAPGPDGIPTDILNDFYVPVLKRAVDYQRVAGYFRSTSLAAASQGFSAFTRNNGKARMIVGADLEGADVSAVLQGQGINTEDPVISTALLNELMGYDTWPEAVQYGVHLLAWMVAKGMLEIRVAFRVHANTGEPLCMDAVDDGYVHMKFGIFRDDQNNGIYMSGSLNESKTALTLNAENIDIHCSWRGEDNAQRLLHAEEQFARLWENKHPCICVMPLPQAVKGKLLDLSEKLAIPREINGQIAEDFSPSRPCAKELLTFAMLLDAPKLPGGRFVGMETAPVTPWPHQEVVARRLIESWPYSYLLCDEVGLGKTIEAGLVIRSLWLSGITRRVLIAAPAGLAIQWQREMDDKFFLPFARTQGGMKKGHAYLLPRERFVADDNLFSPPLNIISTGLVVRPPYRGELEQADPFDIILLDEAHYARRSNPTMGMAAEPRYNKLFSVVSNIFKKKTRALYLATATPMQLDPVEVYDLMGLINRIGPFQYDPGLIEWYYELVGRLADQASLSTLEWDFLKKSLHDITRHDPLYDRFIKDAVVNTRNRLAVRRWLQRDLIPQKTDQRHLGRLIFAASPLNRIMLRHTRPLLKIYRDKGKLGARLAERHILPIPAIGLNALEDTCYQSLSAYCKTLKSQIIAHGGNAQKTAMGFYLMFLRLRFASSTYAIYKSLERRLAKVRLTLSFFDTHNIASMEELDMGTLEDEGEDDGQMIQALLKNREKKDLIWEIDYLENMVDDLKAFSGPSSKMNYLLSILDKRRLTNNRYRQTVIFTRFYDTVVDIVNRLRKVDPAMDVGTYSGRGGQFSERGTLSLKGTSREEIKRRFLNGKTDILVCTDAAAEGLNLQTADLLINFDLPWNPMKVEQRIGRIDRIGQKHETIEVLNLCYLGTAEEIVYGRLLQRLAEAESVVGSQAFSMVPIDEEEFRQLEENEISEDELDSIIQERFRQIRTRARNREIPPRDLYDIYVSMSREYKQNPPSVTLEGIWDILSDSDYLQSMGCRVKDIDLQIIEIWGIPGIVDGTLITTSRETYEYELSDTGDKLNFATYGGEVFDRILSHINAFTMPDCIKRILVDRTKTSGPMVGYAVACQEDDKMVTPLLVTSFDQLARVDICENSVINETELTMFRKKLEGICLIEFQNVYVAGRIQKDNVQAALSQVAFNYLVGISLLNAGMQIGNGRENFYDEICRLEQNCAETEQKLIPHLPVSKLRQLTGLLYSPELPSVGEDVSVRLPVSLYRGALSQALRAANAMHVNKSEILTAQVVSRLMGEFQRTIGWLR